MTRPGTLSWFARHEARLAWRDWLSLMTAGRRRRTRTVVLGFTFYVLCTHGIAWVLLANPDRDHANLLPAITVTLLLTFSLMLSQALESATRLFYARGDLDLILTSPAAVHRLFAVRIAAMSTTTAFMTLVLLAAPIDVLIFRDGARWAGAYLVTIAMAMDASAIAILLTVLMFRLIGPKRTRTVSQIASAIIGAGFAISVQLAAFASYGPGTRLSSARDSAAQLLAHGEASPIWWPPAPCSAKSQCSPACSASARSVARRDPAGRATLRPPLAGSLRIAGTATPTRRKPSRFANRTPIQALRRKEWTLLLRDPWLMSQTLMQLLYLLPPGFLLWRNFYAGGDGSAVLVPILIVTAGQLGGGLAWLAVSGEDAPELIATAPVTRSRVLRAKAEAVLGGIAVVFAPFILALALSNPTAPPWSMLCGILTRRTYRHPVLVPRPGPPQPVPPTPNLLPHRHVCGGACHPWAGPMPGALAAQHCSALVPGAVISPPVQRLDDEPGTQTSAI